MAEAKLAHLLRTTTCQTLLHGDLHHENILRQGLDDWVVIDPKGILGDPHFDTIQFLLNDTERDGDADVVLARRVGEMAKRLHLDPARIGWWGVVRGALEACWALNGGGGDGGAGDGIAISERFARMLRDSRLR
nr:aminoglycoside phosphotransferase family protein [Alicyclobacillus acidiphilus]